MNHNTPPELGPYQQFLFSFDEDNNGCWIWSGKPHQTPYGYGRFGTNYVHRLSYQTFVGPILDGFEIDHLCRNTMCGNPDHLEAVDHRTNTIRGTGFAAINIRKTHCPHGHPYDETNTWRNARGGRWCRTCNREKHRKENKRVD